MTDRELLEAAAKAAGVAIDFTTFSDGSFLCHHKDGDCFSDEWNPLTDDGDALRLAVKLHLCLLFPMRGETYKQCGAGQVGSDQPACMEPHDPDPYAATRRAIVRAAAEIGKDMK
jgi:hypothetical protein